LPQCGCRLCCYSYLSYERSLMSREQPILKMHSLINLFNIYICMYIYIHWRARDAERARARERSRERERERERERQKERKKADAALAGDPTDSSMTIHPALRRHIGASIQQQRSHPHAPHACVYTSMRKLDTPCLRLAHQSLVALPAIKRLRVGCLSAVYAHKAVLRLD
jgi:hypothetical protein